MESGVSVIICCYNSSPRLGETLKHLISQEVNGIAFEIIIVDNASTDDTSTVAREILTSASGIDFTIVREPESGLSFARKKGFDTAKYEYLLYCDDDNWLAENYVQLTYQTMFANPRIGILGGKAEAVFEIPEPHWFKQYEIDFAIGEQSKASKDLSRVVEVYGAGSTLRKSYLELLFNSGFKSILSGRKGTELISGEDSELCYLAKYFGFEVWYHRELRLKHFMTRSRLNWDYMKRLYAGNGKTNVYIQAYKYMENNKEIPGQNLRLPLWLDTYIHKIKYVFISYPSVRRVMKQEGNANVLRFIAVKAEAREVWKLKEKYTKLFETILHIRGLAKVYSASQ